MNEVCVDDISAVIVAAFLAVWKGHGGKARSEIRNMRIRRLQAADDISDNMFDNISDNIFISFSDNISSQY